MSVERYNRLAADFRGTAEAVPPERWSAASPCEGWTALDVVDHVVESHLMQLSFLGQQPGQVDSVQEQPIAALRTVSSAVAAQLADPDRAEQMIVGVGGETTFAESIDMFLSFDLLIHRWDLAQAAGLEAVFDPADMRWAWSVTEGFGEFLRADGVCGPALSPPQDADEQTALLAHLGRRVR